MANEASAQGRGLEQSGIDNLPTGIIEVGEWLPIANEFTGVTLRKVLTRNGERIELLVPKSGKRILLDAMQLEILAAQRPERFTELFRAQLGAE